MSSTDPAATPPRTIRRSGSVKLLFTGALVIYSLLESMIVPALPAIQQAVGASTAALGWVISGLALSGAVCTPLIGRLADVRDKRKVMIGVLAVVCLGIVGSAVATSITLLAIGQILQGAGLGLIPLAIGAIRDVERPEKLRTANGVLIGAMAIASSAGILLAGPILGVLHYTWLYWIALIILVPLGLAAATLVPALPPAGTGKVDWIGAALLGTGLISLLLGVTLAATQGWGAGIVLGLGVLAVAALALFSWVELRIESPLVDLRLGSRIVGLVCLLSFVLGTAVGVLYIAIPTIVSMPLAAGYGLGASAVVISLVLFPSAALAAIASPLTGRLENLIGARAVMMLSGSLAAVGYAILLAGKSSAIVLVVGVSLIGVAIGIGLTQGVNIIAVSLPPDRVASVSGVSYVIRTFGNALGAQLAATIMATSLVPALGVPAWSGISTAFMFAIVIAVLAAALAYALPKRFAPLPADSTDTPVTVAEPGDSVEGRTG